MLRRALAAAVVSLAVRALPAQSAPSGLPKSGVDYSAIDEFYRVADVLKTDAEPTDEQWKRFLATPGYVLLWQQNRNIRRQMATAFRPSARAVRDSILGKQNDDALGLRHLIRALEQRDAVLETRRALETSLGDSIAAGVRNAARFLPRGATEHMSPPFIAFAVFADDGYALDGGILLDPLFVRENGLVPLISHEFHHMYTAALDRTIRPVGMPPYDVALAGAIRSLRNEGIADQIDKPHPLPARHDALALYVTRYNETYDRTPSILRSLDSLLSVVRDDSAKAPAAGMRARQLLWSNGHPNGAYMARTIVETFGVDSLMPGIYDFVAFARTYASAELKRGNPAPFSPKSLAVLDDIERRYVKP